MWTPKDRALAGDVGAGQALSDDHHRLPELFIPPAETDRRTVAHPATKSRSGIVLWRAVGWDQPTCPDFERLLDDRPSLTS